MPKLFKWKSDGWADFGDFKIYDSEVADFLKKHMRLIDRLDVEKVVAAAFYVFTLIQEDRQGKEKLKSGNWKFSFKKDGGIWD